jgi:hypothetical protein
MTKTKALELWHTTLTSTKPALQAKSLINRDGPMAPTEENHERRVEARVQALLEAVDN